MSAPLKTTPVNVYVAGKVAKNSVFGRHDWRDGFVQELQKLSGRQLYNVDPTKTGADLRDPAQIFGADCYMISHCDVVVVYLSDDISVGGSQEILIAKYFAKPVIGLAPHGGKFNGAVKEYFGEVVKNVQDPFVFATCDVVCKTIEEVGEVLKDLERVRPKTLDIIPTAITNYKKHHLAQSPYVKQLPLPRP
ncbi:MAG TPA: hypothetical protein VMY99_00460 [Nevskiaceae bacterium]|nr:hypothetical protein [Nevskiaceae bacterium]